MLISADYVDGGVIIKMTHYGQYFHVSNFIPYTLFRCLPLFSVFDLRYVITV